MKNLKKLNIKQKEELAQKLRDELLKNVSKTGGHLASNLGVVELTIALHSIFNLPKDKIIWDVGHQCYIHKMLTGRKEKMDTLRKYNGIAGFPKTSESEYDAFNTGHSSTSISVASGIARARDLSNKKYDVIAVIGDGALTGGMALEALNDVGSSNLNMKIILNDNEMSISKNVGGMPLLLSKLRTKKSYISINNYIKEKVENIPVIGNKIINLVTKIKNLIKRLLISNMYFEDIGYTYLGPIDGHNIKKLETVLKESKKINGPVLIHVITKKGKGYEIAEEKPNKYHSVSAFDISTGKAIKEKSKDYSQVFGDKLVKLAEKNKKIVAITAAMKEGTGLEEFSKKYKNRFFDVGIAEQHALGLAAGLAKEGIKPFVPMYSSFLQRGYDQIIHDIAMQKLPVVICVDRAGIVGNDGETHQGIFDLSFLNSIPNMTVMAPKDYEELENMIEFASNYNEGPIAIRYPRGTEGKIKYAVHTKIELNKIEQLSKGEDVTIFAIGKMVEKSVKVREILEKKGIKTEIINVRCLKPLNAEEVTKNKDNKKLIITIEDNLLKGGLKDTILEKFNEKNIKTKVISFGYNDKFVTHGSIEELEKENGLKEENIAKDILKELKK